MSLTSLLFPLTGSAGGLGATLEARSTAAPRPEGSGTAFSHWLRQAQPQATSPRAMPAPKAQDPEAQRTSPDARRADAPSPAPAPTAADADPPQPQDETPPADEEAREPVSGELPGAWWLVLPEPPLPAGEGGDLEEALAAHGAGLAGKPASGARTKDADDSAHHDAAEPLVDLAAEDPAPVGADLMEGMTPLLPAATSTPSRAAEGPGATPLPWVSGLSPTQASAAASGATATPSAAQQTLATPVHDPDFPEALAQSITVLTRQGVQEAKLHLNPAEMGTVSVHIAVNGQQAQVDFAASASATRAALEASLSHLAAALHSAGLTLTGGGVSQDTLPRRPSQEASSTGSRPTQGEASAETTALTRPLGRLPSGRLDLYA
ncbi:flagellar hook-length control protein FliK [Caldimonas caldifontis]|uniref:Flagellar hook-length control protein-like C-terminal domain-containing protein n=1 Tax=Caldimonas caldifontis TaxID=1452508 RepID=A0A2S5SYL9_9BURK|nr:flagellar hook-length control protein FliK [Caldimonas caldifontis]PPE67873.1 hypothetical protein C1704_03170 [Caldimonas caldifontis]